MRKYLIALLAVPVLCVVYASAALGRSRFIRAGVAVGLGAVLALGAISLARPTPTTASPVSDIVPLTRAAFQMRVGTNFDLLAPATIMFSTPMERDSVESSVSVDPPADIDLLWNDDHTSVSIVPTEHWTPGTYYTITVGAGALASTGRPMTRPARAAFLTRDAAAAAIAPTSKVEKRVAIDTSFTVAFDQAVDLSTVAGAIRLDPPATGALSRSTGQDGVATYTFDPSRPLAPDTRYRLIVEGVRDAAGLAVEPVTMALRTVAGPEVVRFRPLSGTTEVTRVTPISVRFTQAMDRGSTKRAFSVTADGKRVAGTIRFAEGDTVLVFDPAATLPYDATVVATVAAGARSADGVALATSTKGTFTTEAEAVAAHRCGAADVERRHHAHPAGERRRVRRLGQLGCRRALLPAADELHADRRPRDVGRQLQQPGRSQRRGAASSTPASVPGSPGRTRASWPSTTCARHFSGGNPGDRLRRAGYSNYRWAENLGCRSGNAYSAVLGSHRFFQAERSYNGGHYVNMMNAAYDRVGIGVWVSGGRVRLVIDFYHP